MLVPNGLGVTPAAVWLQCHCFFGEAGEASDLFDINDAYGKITIEEWLDSPRSTSGGETCSMLVKQWAEFYPENVGYLTKDQAINRKA